jgi:hypothetical protein
MENIVQLKNMTIKLQILKELDALENAVVKLNATARNAGQQTDLEVAILTEQVKTLREKNENANALIQESIGILTKLTPSTKI